MHRFRNLHTFRVISFHRLDSTSFREFLCPHGASRAALNPHDVNAPMHVRNHRRSCCSSSQFSTVDLCQTSFRTPRVL
ncbi:hypothetical protein PHAVU_011G111700 [Phaseolus vulgaris]|uniref:Uncharacterized protein n=1 Tax=Phaseolus vulgaris TaxID=3885 RepID=V7AIE2_PHAVU|nr:hypothetical protein PHAVU_011G111700g [Phaseolus vulgaris]ESW04628.1 hypothetical protein PHAVU_011G111700g [Phaseolus vulgaris]